MRLPDKEKSSMHSFTTLIWEFRFKTSPLDIKIMGQNGTGSNDKLAIQLTTFILDNFILDFTAIINKYICNQLKQLDFIIYLYK